MTGGFRRALTLGLLILTLSVKIFAQIPDGYYATAEGKTGAELKTALYNIIKNHTVISYDGLWTAFQYTDKKSNGKVWDMYSDKPGQTPPYEFTFVTDQCGNYSSEGDCYNREHSFPKSWFNDASPMYSDLFHLYPTDGYVNNRRSNFIFGEVTSVTWTSLNGSKLGTSSASGATLTVFEPIDEYKGDFARTYFYMATRYENLIATWASYNTEAKAILDGTAYPAYKQWYITLLLKWNQQDPVSQKEIDRNNVVYSSYQHNRNPFIDHPEYAQLIWGSTTPITFTSTPITSATVGVTYTYNVTATGGNGTPLTISATQKPTWLTLTATGNGTATLSGTPGQENVGGNQITLKATDGISETQQTFTITVSSPVTPIQFTSTPITTAVENQLYTYNATATGGNGASLTITATQKPAWLTLTSTGNGTATLSGTPDHSNIGNSQVVLAATDGANQGTQSFTINVSAAGNSKPLITNVNITPASPVTRQAITISANITDSDGSVAKVLLGWGVTVGNLSNTYEMQFENGAYSAPIASQTSPGTIYFQLAAIDNLQDTAYYNGSFTVNLNQVPTISSVSHTPTNPTSADAVTVTANVSDPEGRIGNIFLLWGITESSLINQLQMSGTNGVYTSVIPANPSQTSVYYRVKAYDAEGQQTLSSISSYIVNPATEIRTETSKQFLVFPNPFNAFIQVEYPSAESYSVTFTNLIGQVVYSKTRVTGNLRIDCSDLQSGIYVLTIKSDTGIVTQKMIKR
ncbi:MAG TPA: endonuclease [Tenuifilum sp.]|uniref:endonuclease n=1 Tax=Tenuifilum sp. TaxID=2760880 RepID=UPI002B6A6C5E|nr:endonuclease [Tenuifilum sp.]